MGCYALTMAVSEGYQLVEVCSNKYGTYSIAVCSLKASQLTWCEWKLSGTEARFCHLLLFMTSTNTKQEQSTGVLGQQSERGTRGWVVCSGKEV